MMVSTMTASFGSVPISRTNDWSIFKGVQRQAFQIGRDECGAEVIDREADAQCRERVHALHGLFDVVDNDTFGDFQRQNVPVGRLYLPGSPHAFDETGLDETVSG